MTPRPSARAPCRTSCRSRASWTGRGLAHDYDPGALKVTISKFYRPSGASTQLRGVAADVVLPSPSDVSEVSESALKDPLPWDVVPSASYERQDRVQPYLADLRGRSTRRVAEEKDFAYLAGDIARVKQSLATKSVSLNEADRRTELAQDKARHEAREREDRALRATGPTTYEITLANASSPGLPPPVASTKHANKASSARSSGANVPDEPPSGRAAADDIILSEGERVLADYVDLLTRQDARGDLGAR